MTNWLVDTLNGFMAKLGLPVQHWQQSPQLSLQFDGDITCEILVMEESLMLSFLVPVFLANQTQVLNYLCRKNAVHSQSDSMMRHHWFNNQAVIQMAMAHSHITEISLEQAFSSLLSHSQTIKAM